MPVIDLNKKDKFESNQKSETIIQRLDVVIVLGMTIFGTLMLSTLFYLY